MRKGPYLYIEWISDDFVVFVTHCKVNTGSKQGIAFCITSGFVDVYVATSSRFSRKGWKKRKQLATLIDLVAFHDILTQVALGATD